MGLPLVLLFGLILHFISDEIPSWFQQINKIIQLLGTSVSLT